MLINLKKCSNPEIIIPYCPVGAIKGMADYVYIDQDECVECGQCLRSRVLPPGALYLKKLEWPRTLRAEFSNPNVSHSSTESTGRGTEEMKTNDVTGRYKKGEAGFAIELGRPHTGASFIDIEKVTMKLAEYDIVFESNNPVTFLIDPLSGRLKDDEVRKERVLSAIIEFKTREDQSVEIIKIIQEAGQDISTVASVSIINKCVKGEIPVLSFLKKANIKVRCNGKTCIGLGRPRAKD